MTRAEKLRNELPEGFGAAIIASEPNRAYISGFDASSGYVVVTEKRAVLMVDFRYIEAARKQAEGVEVVLLDEPYKQISELLAGEGAAAALAESEISVGAFAAMKKGVKGVKIASDGTLSRALSKLRSIKDDGEIKRIKAAQKLTDAAFDYILGFIEEGRTELEIAAELEYHMRRNGADGTAFSTICVAGKNTSKPHGVPTSYKVKKGDFVTLDFGARLFGYCSDMTRTVAVGSVSDEQKHVYATVLSAHLSAVNAAKAGMTGRQLDKVARDIIDEEGFKGRFGHGLGHSLGLEVHEPPRAGVSCDDVLEENVIMTIEPGIYLEGKFGVRIENMVRLKRGGCDDLTASPRELIVL